MKTFAFRFDIDTPTCLREGVPRLLDLSDRLDVQFTYFLSLGRAVSRMGALKRAFGRSRAPSGRAVGLSARRKLGLGRYVQLALLNQEIGRGSPSLVRTLSTSADLGLHGGRNHDHWQHRAQGWTKTKVEAEVDWGLAWLAEMEIDVKGFCSPGWSQPESLAEVLVERGFTYRADRHGVDETGAQIEAGGLLNLGTNIAGEPGGVAYLEHMRASGASDSEIREAFRQRLRGVGDYAVSYDHPYYAGLHALQLLESLVQVAKDEGFVVTTMSAMADSLAVKSVPPDGAVPQ
jgi:peptidoglycan/xylan/chitin deacetylase (PgdA/CDA1 family)